MRLRPDTDCVHGICAYRMQSYGVQADEVQANGVQAYGNQVYGRGMKKGNGEGNETRNENWNEICSGSHAGRVHGHDGLRGQPNGER